MKNFMIILICIMVILNVSLGSFAATGDKKTIGLVNINLQAIFFNQIYNGAKKAAQEKDVNLIHIDSRSEITTQINGIENLIQEKVDAIILVAVDVDAVLPVIEDAKKAGIPTISIDAKVKVPPAVAFIGVNNYGAGVQSGEFTVNYVKENMGGKAKIGIIGALGWYIQNLRRDGFLEAVQKEEGIEIVGTVDGNNVQEVAMAAAENIVTANPDMDIIYATGEPALIGAVAAVKSGGYEEKIKIIGWDLHKQVIQGIDEGFVVGVVQQNPYEEGYQAVLASLKLIAGKEIPEETLIPITIVTKENVDKYRETFK